jgi:hypothetical protein
MCQINIEKEFANPFGSVSLRKGTSHDVINDFIWLSLFTFQILQLILVKDAPHSSGMVEKGSWSLEEDSEISRNQTQRLRTKRLKTNLNGHEKEREFSWKPSQSTASVPT